ncbi:hypothetical protein ERJ75_000980300 [Trypanosoma vivax]|uniref:Uncharacterized protein n=1 Tax=Trypanosoma vivax (strain Y486) TaxID=1055687 RepID=G0U6V5_TRYVY|nr:hypothetical protein TRVL_02172 [Trypanosoma vivax]KAH8611884.1 hypothetical protein ERJ75_000980300 [Trypanosoma vivax]CCC51611.1 hypothetical protein TVY486_1006590 [Trypanosoma vivax Y486]
MALPFGSASGENSPTASRPPCTPRNSDIENERDSRPMLPSPKLWFCDHVSNEAGGCSPSLNSTPPAHKSVGDESSAPQRSVNIHLLSSTSRRGHSKLLLAPLPSPDQGKRSQVALQCGLCQEVTETKDAVHLCEVLKSNENLQQELTVVRGLLNKAKERARVREQECAELRQLVRELRSQVLPKMRSPKEASRTLVNSSTRISAVEVGVSQDAADVQADALHVNGDTSPAVERSFVSPIIRHACHTEGEEQVGEKEELAPLSGMGRSAASRFLKKNRVFLRNGRPDADLLAAELVRVKSLLAEQQSVLDRLGLKAPFSPELVGAARHLVSSFEPIRRKRVRRLNIVRKWTQVQDLHLLHERDKRAK